MSSHDIDITKSSYDKDLEEGLYDDQLRENSNSKERYSKDRGVSPKKKNTIYNTKKNVCNVGIRTSLDT